MTRLPCTTAQRGNGYMGAWWRLRCIRSLTECIRGVRTVAGALSTDAPIDAPPDVERVEGAVLDGVAVELGRRLARVHGLPAPSFPCEFHADVSKVSDRGLALWALWQAQQLDALARPQLSREGLFLALGAAEPLAADPLIVPPPCRPGGLAHA